MKGMRSWAASCVATVLLLAPFPFQAHADIYRYVDEHGVEHYTNYQQNGGRARRIIRTRKPAINGHGGGPINPADGDPARVRRYDEHIREAALLYVLPEDFIRAVMHVESNFNPNARSHRGAIGLMQLMPTTAQAMGVDDPYDPRQNVLGGSRLLRVLANRFAGDQVLTLAAYNAGESAVRKYGGVPPYDETQRYVQRVLSRYDHYRAERDNAKPSAPKRNTPAPTGDGALAQN
jgi:soluble lytic murein transglycosylase-like protein